MAKLLSLSWIHFAATSSHISQIGYREQSVFSMSKIGRRLSIAGLASRDGGRNRGEFDVRFPRDYSELLDQAKVASALALKDNKQLLEIEFPTAGLGSVPGDREGGTEMTESMRLIREFADRIVPPEKSTRTRIFFPEANEVDFARRMVFQGALFKLDYLTKPSIFEDFGIVSRVLSWPMAGIEKTRFQVCLFASAGRHALPEDSSSRDSSIGLT
ncbi:hypothetical protein HPP92_025933 [Vanilla planifolia]|uniref:DUF1995 domain-containing protein n=1 Tax=Vanilla planifolia TaxID=51239 RepID=A0A835PK60_VANPL|nr:hypothetical protein HPP92_025933 [Vanilla planifolia]